MNPAPRQSRGPARGKPPPGPGNIGPLVPVSFAKQTKSLEERLYARFKELDPEAVRVTRYRGASIQEEILLKNANDGIPTWYSNVEAEKLLSEARAKSALMRAIMRAPARLKKTLSSVAEFNALTDEERRWLLMTQKEWNSFRGPFQDGEVQTSLGAPQGTPGAGSQDPAQA